MSDPFLRRLTPSRVRGRLQRGWMARQEQLYDHLHTAEDRRLLEVARGGRDVCWTDEGVDEPLVTIRIATYGRGDLIARRALPSATAQTYEHLEILVVGDHCDATTERAVHSVRDPRVRFVNLGARGLYPDGVRNRRLVAGAHPMNVGRALARGSWFAPCDDDDELTDDHVEVLLAHARAHRLEMVWSRSLAERWPGQWQEVGGDEIRQGGFSHGSVLYSSGLRFMAHSTTCWKRNEPSDWNLWRRMQRIGVRMGFCDHLTYYAYLGAVRRAASGRS